MIDQSMRGDNRWPLFLAVAAVAAVLPLLWPPRTTVIPTWDTPLYEKLGHNLAAGKGFVAPDRGASAEVVRPARPGPNPRAYPPRQAGAGGTDHALGDPPPRLSILSRHLLPAEPRQRGD